MDCCQRKFVVVCNNSYHIRDRFTDPFGGGERFGYPFDLPFSKPYDINYDFQRFMAGSGSF
jgi:hypothetical protein